MAKIYFYKLTNDGGGAPCVERGLLSLAICKPKIRVSAEPDDVVFGFTANSLDKKNRLLYIAKVTGKEADGDYFRLRKYSARRDCIYKMREKKFAWKKGALYHNKPDDLVHDLGSPPHYSKAVVLLSNDFRYFGANGTDDYKSHYPNIKKAIETLGRGHRVHLDERLRIELDTLMNSEWRKTSRKVLGKPTSQPRPDACYRDVSCGQVVAAESRASRV
jgi:hypothetical protein